MFAVIAGLSAGKIVTLIKGFATETAPEKSRGGERVFQSSKKMSSPWQILHQKP